MNYWIILKGIDQKERTASYAYKQCNNLIEKGLWDTMNMSINLKFTVNILVITCPLKILFIFYHSKPTSHSRPQNSQPLIVHIFFSYWAIAKTVSCL